MDKPKLYVLVGLSGSGKSTLAAQLAESNEKYCHCFFGCDTRGINREDRGSVEK